MGIAVRSLPIVEWVGQVGIESGLDGIVRGEDRVGIEKPTTVVEQAQLRLHPGKQDKKQQAGQGQADQQHTRGK
jgi:hypothetical protein